MHGSKLWWGIGVVISLTFGSYAHDKQLLVLVPPSIYDPYYEKLDLTEFYVNYANAIKGKDDVVLVIEEESVEKFRNAGITDDMIIVGRIDDPWIRDFSYVRPQFPTAFRFIGGNTLREAWQTQRSFERFAAKHKLSYRRVGEYVDGGNVVENGYDMAIVTDKFLGDNYLHLSEAYTILKKDLGISRVAIITADEPVLGHADGMVAITGEHTVLLTSYDEPFRSQILAELEYDLPGVDIIEIPTFNDRSTFQGGYASSCGVYINSVVTHNYIYVPQFGHPYDAKALHVIEEHGNGRTVVPVDARDVCKMGGSLRCLSWQVEGRNAERLLAAAKAAKK